MMDKGQIESFIKQTLQHWIDRHKKQDVIIQGVVEFKFQNEEYNHICFQWTPSKKVQTLDEIVANIISQINDDLIKFGSIKEVNIALASGYQVYYS